jgi:DsbC/DsbD-like thiol-disulfide interchange protein
MKRQLLGVLASVMTASALIAAQSTTAPPQNPTPAKADITVTGCLIQGSSPAVFVLDNAKQKPDDKAEKAASYVVTQAAEDLPLAANLNHEVSVTGSADVKAMAPPSGQKAAEKDLPRFSAKTVTLVADRCTAATR